MEGRGMEPGNPIFYILFILSLDYNFQIRDTVHSWI